VARLRSAQPKKNLVGRCIEVAAPAAGVPGREENTKQRHLHNTRGENRGEQTASNRPVMNRDGGTARRTDSRKTQKEHLTEPSRNAGSITQKTPSCARGPGRLARTRPKKTSTNLEMGKFSGYRSKARTTHNSTNGARIIGLSSAGGGPRGGGDTKTPPKKEKTRIWSAEKSTKQGGTTPLFWDRR